MCLFGIHNFGQVKLFEVWNVEVPDVLWFVIWGSRDYLLSIKFFFEIGQLIIWGLQKTLVWLFAGPRKLLDISTPVQKAKEFLPLGLLSADKPNLNKTINPFYFPLPPNFSFTRCCVTKTFIGPPRFWQSHNFIAFKMMMSSNLVNFVSWISTTIEISIINYRISASEWAL